MALYCSKELVNPWEKAGVAGHGSVVTDLSVPRSAQAIKKGGRECRQQQGVERVEKRWTLSSGTTLFRRSGVPWVRFTYCEKRRGPTPSQFDALPLHRRSTQRITRGSPTGRRHYDQTTNGVSNPRKSRGPTLCSVGRIHPF